GSVMSMTVTSPAIAVAVAARRPWAAGPARASVSHGVRAELSPARTAAASCVVVTLVVTMSEYQVTLRYATVIGAEPGPVPRDLDNGGAAAPNRPRSPAASRPDVTTRRW